jgi:hypothetical protein
MKADDPSLDLEGHGLNAVGHEEGNAQACEGRTLAWLQDQPGVDVWEVWDIAYRDCVVLDASNRVYAIYNLTLHDLNATENFEELEALVLEAAAVPP